MARDTYHEVVKAALISDAWQITHDPFVLKAGGLRMEVDLAADKVFAAERGTEKIVVEVKSFLNPSKLYDFYEAKGQYDLYRRGLRKTVNPRTLYLAVEDEVFDTFFQKPLIWETVEEEAINLLIFNVLTEKIVRWIKHPNTEK